MSPSPSRRPSRSHSAFPRELLVADFLTRDASPSPSTCSKGTENSAVRCRPASIRANLVGGNGELRTEGNLKLPSLLPYPPPLPLTPKHVWTSFSYRYVQHSCFERSMRARSDRLAALSKPKILESLQTKVLLLPSTIQPSQTHPTKKTLIRRSLLLLLFQGGSLGGSPGEPQRRKSGG